MATTAQSSAGATTNGQGGPQLEAPTEITITIKADGNVSPGTARVKIDGKITWVNERSNEVTIQFTKEAVVGPEDNDDQNVEDTFKIQATKSVKKKAKKLAVAADYVWSDCGKLEPTALSHPVPLSEPTIIIDP